MCNHTTKTHNSFGLLSAKFYSRHFPRRKTPNLSIQRLPITNPFIIKSQPLINSFNYIRAITNQLHRTVLFNLNSISKGREGESRLYRLRARGKAWYLSFSLFALVRTIHPINSANLRQRVSESGPDKNSKTALFSYQSV